MRIRTSAVLVGALVLAVSASVADAAPAAGEPMAATSSESYPQPAATPTVDPKVVIRAKAMARAKQRADRMAANEWYGYNPSRPRTTVVTPFVGPGAFGGRPAYVARRPFFIFR